MIRSVKELSLLLLAVVLLLVFTVSACFSPADLYAVEVVLNKPGVAYDLSKLAEVKGVEKVFYGPWCKEAYAYKSHYNGNLIVVVSVQGLKCASVKTEPSPAFSVAVKGYSKSADELATRIGETSVNWNRSKLDSTYIFSKKIGSSEVFISIKVEPSKSKDRSDITIGLWITEVEEISDSLAQKIKSEIDKLFTKITLSDLSKLIKVNVIKIALAKYTTQEYYIAIRIQIPLMTIAETVTVYSYSTTYSSQSLNVSKLELEKAEQLGWKTWVKRLSGNYLGFILSKTLNETRLTLSGKGVNSTIELDFKVVGLEKLSEDILSDFREVLKAIGLSENIVDSKKFKKYSESTGFKYVPAVSMSEEDVKKALEIELNWLLEKKIISGLSEKDISNIVSAARLGYAGWNSRLIWHNDKWVSYSSTPGALILKCISLPPQIFSGKEYGSRTESSSTSTQSTAGEYLSLLSTEYLYVILAVSLIVAILAYIAARKRYAS